MCFVTEEKVAGGPLAPETLPSTQERQGTGRKGRIQMISWEFLPLIWGDFEREKSLRLVEPGKLLPWRKLLHLGPVDHLGKAQG